jgi:Putative zinc-finger
MNCAQIEILICDYLDGTLPGDDQAEVKRHLAECPGCAELARDSAAAVAFIGRAAEVAPPPELVTRILFDAPWRKHKPAGNRLRGWFSLALQPKFVMGAAMTILSFSILSQLAPVRQLRASDLEPRAVWRGLEDRVLNAWDRTVKYYDNLRFVYQIQSTLREWQQQDEEQRPAKRPRSRTTDDHKLPVTSTPQGEPANAGGGNH